MKQLMLFAVVSLLLFALPTYADTQNKNLTAQVVRLVQVQLDDEPNNGSQLSMIVPATAYGQTVNTPTNDFRIRGRIFTNDATGSVRVNAADRIRLSMGAKSFRVLITGTIGNVDISEGFGLIPHFTNGEADIVLNGDLDESTVGFGAVPPGNYTAPYMVTAFLF